MRGLELVVRLRRLGYERGTASAVVFVPDPTAWTEVPESVGVLGRGTESFRTVARPCSRAAVAGGSFCVQHAAALARLDAANAAKRAERS